MHSPEPFRPDTVAAGTAGDAVSRYLNAQAAEFLRGLRRHGESGAESAAVTESARALRAASRRIGGTLHTFRALLDPGWADGLRNELGWLSVTLAREHACTARLSRLLDALARLSGTACRAPARGEAPPPPCRALPAQPHAEREGGVERHTSAQAGDGTGPAGHDCGTAEAAPATRTRTRGRAHENGGGTLAVGAARAGALLERQLTLARTRAHSAALQALGSSRFHAVADSVTLLASELPLTPAAAGPAAETLALPAQAAERRLLEAVAGLPLARAAHPYNAEALINGLSTGSAGDAQDAPWHEVRRLLRLHRYAQEVMRPGADALLRHAGLVLDRHRDAAEAATAAAEAARTPRIAPATAYALGVLHADQRHEVEAARFAFQQQWRHAMPAVTAP